MRSWLLGLALVLAACRNDSGIITLDGRAICPPKEAVLTDTPSWLKNMKGLDTSYGEVSLRIVPHRVLVANESAIRGRSQTQEELLRAATSGKVGFNPIEGTTFYKVVPRPEFPNLGWEVVRWRPKGDEGMSPQSLSQWIVGHCSLINNAQSCLVQRIYAGLAYEFYYHGPLNQIDAVTGRINEQLDRWQTDCRRGAQQSAPADRPRLASLGSSGG